MSDDQALAVTALYEGDAMAGSLDYLLANPGLAARLAFAVEPASAALDQAPPVLAIWLIFPYVQGQEFVTALRADGGWAAVDAAYADLPASTEQILHPEKYLARDEPTAVTLPAPTVLGDGWTVVDENNVGELQTAILLAELAPGEGVNGLMGTINLPRGARQAAAGWDGDRYSLWSDGAAEVLVWRSVWDSAEEATEFARALQTREERRFGGLFAGDTAGDLTMVAGDHALRIVQDGTDVRYVLAPTPELAEQALAALVVA
jgi:hypothetical protein